jgi:hypothetical protein
MDIWSCEVHLNMLDKKKMTSQNFDTYSYKQNSRIIFGRQRILCAPTNLFTTKTIQ